MRLKSSTSSLAEKFWASGKDSDMSFCCFYFSFCPNHNSSFWRGRKRWMRWERGGWVRGGLGDGEIIKGTGNKNWWVGWGGGRGVSPSPVPPPRVAWCQGMSRGLRYSGGGCFIIMLHVRRLMMERTAAIIIRMRTKIVTHKNFVFSVWETSCRGNEMFITFFFFSSEASYS